MVIDTKLQNDATTTLFIILAVILILIIALIVLDICQKK